jgi:hypothetical protein
MYLCPDGPDLFVAVPIRSACVVVHWSIRVLENISHRSSLSCHPASAFSLSRASRATPSLLVQCGQASRHSGSSVATGRAGHYAEARAALDMAARRHLRPRSWADQRTSGSRTDLARFPSRAGTASLPRRAATTASPMPTTPPGHCLQ